MGSSFIALQEIQEEETNADHDEHVTVVHQLRVDNNRRKTVANRGKDPIVIPDNEQRCLIILQQHGEEFIEIDIGVSNGQDANARELEMDLTKEVTSN
ncbi:hypothetical protein V6N13_024725 [Hibiscus sabdariffa]